MNTKWLCLWLKYLTKELLIHIKDNMVSIENIHWTVSNVKAIYFRLFYYINKQIRTTQDIMAQDIPPKHSHATYDNVDGFCNACHIDDNHQGGCLATCTAARCECSPFGNLSQWTEKNTSNQHPSSNMKWSVLHVICSTFGMAWIMNVMLYNSFYSHLHQLDGNYPGKTCSSCCGMLCCPACALVKMERLEADFEQRHTNTSGGNVINTMNQGGWQNPSF